MNTLLLIIILIIIIDFLFGLWLDWLNDRHRADKLPTELQDIYDDEKYKKSITYGKVNFRFGIITGTFSILITIAILFFGGFAWLSDLILGITNNFIYQSLLFFGILYFANDIINLPFSIYDTFVIEKKFGFNKTTIRTFILDKIKSWILTIVIGGLILGLILYFYQITGKNF
ncbi:MAG: M48 family peptidase, partial [Bacteroidota bacterium]|nr:M48 family peptidase [Bacteroidota bacterium]